MIYLKYLLALILGFLAGGLVVAICESPINLLYPLPAGAAEDASLLQSHLRSIPLWGKLLVVLGWTVGSFVAAYSGRKAAPGQAVMPGLLAGVGIFVATWFTVLSLPHPLWMIVTGPLGSFLGAVVGLLIGSPKSLVVTSQRIIQAPQKKVFQIISSPEGFQQAVPGIKKIEYLTDSRTGVGTRFRETREFRGKEASSTLEITELQSPDFVRMVSREGGAVWDTRFDLKPDSQGSRLTMTMDVLPQTWLARGLTPLVLGIVKGAIENDMDDVKTYCESA